MAFAEPTDGARIVELIGPPRTVLLNGTVQPGDPLFNNGTGFVRADASDTTKRAQMVALNGGISGEYADAGVEAYVDFGSGCTATHGSDLFLSDTAGDYAASAGTITYRIGRMLNARVAHVWGNHS